MLKKAWLSAYMQGTAQNNSHFLSTRLTEIKTHDESGQWQESILPPPHASLPSLSASPSILLGVCGLVRKAAQVDIQAMWFEESRADET